MWNRFVDLVSEICASPPPPSRGAGARVFNAAPAFFRYRVTLWLLSRLVVLVGVVGPIIGLELLLSAEHQVPAVVLLVFRVLEGSALGLWLLSLPVGYALARLDFEQRWYVVSDRSLRIREGVLVVRDMTLTFANVQNVTVEQGPLQRAFGIADLRVQTAGGGGAEQPGQPSMHTGFLRGLANAPELRELVMARLRVGQDAGLGDLDEAPAGDDAATAAAVAALLEQARALGATARRLSPG